MTYEEIKRRLSKCQKSLEKLQEKDLKGASLSVRQEVQKDIKVLNESIVKYKNLLKEEKGVIFTDDEAKAKDLADDGANVKLTKEEEGVEFSVEETKAIAKKVGKALAMSLKSAGDAVSSMKAHRIEENSFDIKVLYKNGSDDEFSFYISGDRLHLQDFSFDKELVDVGVKPSGEAIVNVDVLANELKKHFASLKENLDEVNYNHYTTPKHFDICPGAEALRDEVIEGGKSPEELGEWTFKHDELFKLEKAVLKAKKADERHVKAADKLRDEIIHLSRDLGIEAGKINYLNGHVKKIEDVAAGKEVDEYNSGIYYDDEKTKPRPRVKVKKEGDGKHYIKVPKAEYQPTMQVIDNNAYGDDVADIVDNDGAGNVIIYFKHDENLYDLVMDLGAYDIDVVDHTSDAQHYNDVDEARDINDPALVKYRAAKIAAKKKAAQRADDRMARAIGDNPYNSRKDSLVAKLKAMRAQIMRDMEQEAEPEGGPVADAYGEKLNKIDAAIAKATGRKEPTYGLTKEGQPTAFDDESMDALRDIILKYVEDPDDAERLVQQVDDHGLDSLPSDIEAQLERDPEFEAWYHKLHYGSDADTDYMQRRRAEKDYMEEDTDVGHQDDEPSMLKNTAYESATYAAKLYKKLAKYDQHDGEVDFPNWWQSKLILAKDYLSKAFHYLDSEEKQPMLDKLALEEGVNEGTELYDRNGINIKRFSGGKKGVMVQITYGMDYIQVPADEFPILARAMQSVIGDLKDMNRQVPRSKNVDEEGSVVYMNHSAGKIQKAHGQVVAKMKELAKQYKAGDKSVVGQLKDLTAKKKKLEKALEKKVAGIGKNQNLGVDDTRLDELSGDQQEAIMDLQNILDDAARLGDEAREIIREKFPRMLSKGDAYGAFEFGSSANRYDTTLSSIIEEIEEYYDEEEDVDEGKYKSDAQRKAIYATKAEKGELNEYTDDTFTGAELIDQVKKDSPDMFGKQLFAAILPKGMDSEYEAHKALHAHDNSRIKQRMGGRLAPMFVHVQYHDLEHEGEKYRLHNRQYYNSNFKDKDPDFNPAVSKITLIKVVKDGDSKRGHDKTENLGSVLVKTDEYVKDLRDLPGLGQRHMEEVIKEGATCCGRCGRVHVKGSGCKRPYLKGKSHCRNK